MDSRSKQYIYLRTLSLRKTDYADPQSHLGPSLDRNTVSLQCMYLKSMFKCNGEQNPYTRTHYDYTIVLQKLTLGSITC